MEIKYLEERSFGAHAILAHLSVHGVQFEEEASAQSG
jgi:hypothetical protein